MYPFPLAANSSRHSDYHRYLLGADPAALAPLPRPRCLGQLAGLLPNLAEELTLPRWRKLFRASFPWQPGFGADHYAVGALAPYRPVPAAYGRPRRRFAAFDFVQIADPSLGALALVGGDGRAADSFVALNGRYCRTLERGVAAEGPEPLEARTTGRCLLGLFAEPGNRWLMPLLHVHARVLNFTSHAGDPARLLCLDADALAGAGQRARAGWAADQAEAMSRLGYRTVLDPGLPPSLLQGGRRPAREPGLQVEGVSSRLLASLDAPRVAVLRVLERLLAGRNLQEGLQEGRQKGPPQGAPDWARVAALADRLEQAIVLSRRAYRPSKIALPSGGPWIRAVRTALREDCAADLSELDRAVARARGMAAAPALEPPAQPLPAALFPAAAGDAAHRHAPDPDALDSPVQEPCEPDFGPAIDWARSPAAGCPGAPEHLAIEFERILGEVRAEIRTGDFERNLAPYQSALRAIDTLGRGTPAAALREEAAGLEQSLGREAGERRPGMPPAIGRSGRALPGPSERTLAVHRDRAAREIGGRHL